MKVDVISGALLGIRGSFVVAAASAATRVLWSGTQPYVYDGGTRVPFRIRFPACRREMRLRVWAVGAFRRWSEFSASEARVGVHGAIDVGPSHPRGADGIPPAINARHSLLVCKNAVCQLSPAPRVPYQDFAGPIVFRR